MPTRAYHEPKEIIRQDIQLGGWLVDLQIVSGDHSLAVTTHVHFSILINFSIFRFSTLAFFFFFSFIALGTRGSTIPRATTINNWNCSGYQNDQNEGFLIEKWVIGGILMCKTE